MYRLNNMLLKNQWVNEEIKEEIRKYLKTSGNKSTTFQNLWHAAKAVLRVYNDTGLPQETRKVSNNLTWYLKELDKDEQSPKSAEGRK